MRRISIRKGLDVPISGQPAALTTVSPPIAHVALIGDDYPGMKPTMLVSVGDRVACGQPLFSDKKNDGVLFVAPGAGEVTAISRGPKRKFESLVIRLEGDESVSFCNPGSTPSDFEIDELRKLLVDSGLWCSFRTRPYGKIPAIASSPAALFVTAIDTEPLGPDMDEIITPRSADFFSGLQLLRRLVDTQVYLCVEPGQQFITDELPGIETCEFDGPHPAGLPSTHIHFLDPVNENKTVWHIGAQDVIAIGGLLRTGTLVTDRVIALGGPAVAKPRHVLTRLGASLVELCAGEIGGEPARIISGSVLDGRQRNDFHGNLGRYHQQVSCLPESTGRQFFGWLMPGSDRFSVTGAFLSAFVRPETFPLNTAIWGGDRAIFPLGTYEKVMPLDIVPIYLLKSLASGNSEKAKALGCLELIEEDLALCSYVCPGKNDFGPMLRETLTTIETEG
jgi:Na+-transporting NADH:ubiquinone oxidoreductase subunit A